MTSLIPYAIAITDPFTTPKWLTKYVMSNLVYNTTPKVLNTDIYLIDSIIYLKGYCMMNNVGKITISLSNEAEKALRERAKKNLRSISKEIEHMLLRLEDLENP